MRDIAEYALDALRKAGADKASCGISVGRTDEFKFKANDFSQMRTVISEDISLKAIRDGRMGRIEINSHEREAVDRAVADCMALAAAASPDEAHDIAPKVENKEFDHRIGGGDKAGLYDRAEEFLAATAETFPRLKLEELTAQFWEGRRLYLNTNGAEFGADREWYDAYNFFSAVEGEKTSAGNYLSTMFKSLDAPFMDMGMQRALMAEADRSLDSRPLEGKFVGKIIVTPACFDMIWWNVVQCFLSDLVLIEGTSPWKDALGTAVADPRLTLRAAPRNPLMVAGEDYTYDGFESRDADYIRGGVLESFALSLYGANKTGLPRSANTASWNIEVAPGDVPLGDLIAGVERGVLINRFAGGDPGPSGDVTGVAKNSFLIENGRVTDALTETMVSFNLQAVLRNIAGISRERVGDGVSLLPWCCFDGVTVSGR